jgi:xanthine dehydrogenase accessory factor
MREVFGTMAKWLDTHVPFAAGTLVQAFESAPAAIGTTIAVDETRRIAGNIGAGCYESDIVETCLQTIGDGAFRVLPINLSSDDEIIGSSGCGGALKIAIWKPLQDFAVDASAIALGVEDVTVRLPQGFTFTIPARQHLVVVGATTLANDLARLCRGLDFFVTIVDPRPLFATAERLRDADEVVMEWPQDYLPRVLDTCAALLVVSHDPKFDLPALSAGLRSAVPYIGLLGSRRSQASRRQSLRELGFTDADLMRIHGPAGLDLGGHTTGETALSILAQVVADARGRSGMPLERTTGSIHSLVSAATTSATAM